MRSFHRNRFGRLATALAIVSACAVGASAADLDGDGFADAEDNCIERPNGLDGPEALVQRDTDLDGFGNRCDADFDNDGRIGNGDFRLLARTFGRRIGEPRYDPAVDMDGNGVVDNADFALFAGFFAGRPGPSGLACAGTSPCPRQNVLILIADDVGIDNVGIYRDLVPSAPPQPEHVPPDTPRIDSLALAGIRFDRAWANPLCSPTRATLLTGLHAFRTGMGAAVGGGDRRAFRIDPGLPSIARVYREAGYATAAFGKWHLSPFCYADRTPEGGCPEDDPETPEIEGYDLGHPLEMGFDYFEGASNVADYCDWPKVRIARNPDGSAALLHNAASTTYATIDTVDAAVAWIALAGQTDDASPAPPWFAWVAFNAAHKPFHRADAGNPCPMTSGGLSPAQQYDSMVERLDDEIGRLLDAIPPPVLSRTIVVFLGDNGTVGAAVTPPMDPRRAKGTPYQGGINVPFIVKGRMVTARPAGETSGALVSSADLFATLTSLGRLALPPEVAEDSRSFASQLANPGSSTGRRSVYAERFSPNGFGPVSRNHRALRDDRMKLIRVDGVGFEGYDLSIDDPFELDDVVPAPSREQRDRLYCLAEEMSELRGETWSYDDFDGDGVPNGADNCSALANPTQCNTNSLVHCAPGSLPDDIGNPCDPDFDCDGEVDDADAALLAAALGSAVGDADYDPDIDMNCDGSIDLADDALFVRYRLGPSGCGAGIPCPADPPEACP